MCNARRVWTCFLVCCVIQPFAARPLQAQRVAPVGARPLTEGVLPGKIAAPLGIAVRRAPSDSSRGDRVQHAVVGAAIGAVVGLGLGYYRGRMADADCSSECGGPRIATLVYPPLYGMLGGAIGALVGYVFPI